MLVIDFNDMNKMPPITKEAALEIRNHHNDDTGFSSKVSKVCFSRFPEYQLPKKEDGNYYGHINLPFGDGIIGRVFPEPLWLTKNRDGQQVWRSIKEKEEFDTITRWCSDRGNYVYLRDCLSASATLGFNKVSNVTPEYTEVGGLVSNCKGSVNELAISRLTELAMEFINKHDIYKNCDYVVAVPPNTGKGYDLPSTLAVNIAQELSVPNITPHFNFGTAKSSAKEVKNDDPEWFDKKWNIWQSANLTYNGETLAGKKILLIDDNYQSGLSLQYVAMILQNAGAHQVYGLTMTKTLRDRGN